MSRRGPDLNPSNEDVRQSSRATATATKHSNSAKEARREDLIGTPVSQGMTVSEGEPQGCSRVEGEALRGKIFFAAKREQKKKNQTRPAAGLQAACGSAEGMFWDGRGSVEEEGRCVAAGGGWWMAKRGFRIRRALESGVGLLAWVRQPGRPTALDAHSPMAGFGSLTRVSVALIRLERHALNSSHGSRRRKGLGSG